jgi:hypothetical protein
MARKTGPENWPENSNASKAWLFGFANAHISGDLGFAEVTRKLARKTGPKLARETNISGQSGLRLLAKYALQPHTRCLTATLAPSLGLAVPGFAAVPSWRCSRRGRAATA